MSSNESLIKHFYNAFQQKDFKTMQNAYHEDAMFSDPVFKNLTSREVKAMWEMLLSASSDIRIIHNNVKSDASTGNCHWEAWYTFSTTGRKVHNVIDATFIFRDGKIISHKDRFNFWKWSCMALGTSGYLLGWSPLLLNKVRATARKRLDQFIAKHSDPSGNI